MKLGQREKRGLALLLSAVMMMQTVLTGTAGVTGRSSSPGNFPISGTPSEAFHLLSLRLNDQVSTSNTFHFWVDAEMNTAYLQDIYEEKLENADIMDEEDWANAFSEYKSYDEYLNAQDFFATISFSSSFTFADGVVEAAPIKGPIMADVEVASGTIEKKKIGSYDVRISTVEGVQKAIFTCTLDNLVYYYTNVKFGQDVDMTLDGVYDSSTDIEHEQIGTGNDFKITIDSQKNQADLDSNYTLTKEATQRDKANPNIEYKIIAKVASASEATPPEASGSESSSSETKTGSRKRKKARSAASNSEVSHKDFVDPENDEDWEDDGDGIFRGPGLTGLIERLTPKSNKEATASEISGDVTLAGKIISDPLPTGLTIESISKQINGGEAAAIYENGESTSEFLVVTDGGFEYKVEEVEGEPVTSVILIIKTRLSDEEYNNYMVSGEPGEWKFLNKAFLKDDEGKTLAIGKADEEILKLGASLVKNGEALANYSNRRFEWTLEVNSLFSNGGVELYAVDSIKNVEKTHHYRTAVIGDTSENTGIIIDGTEYEINDFSAEPLTGEEAKAYAVENITTVAAIEAVFEKFSADNTKPLIYKYSAEDGTYNQVMLIPLSNYKNKQVEIKYWTDVAVTIDDLLIGQSDEVALSLSNTAKLFWRWPSGHGVGDKDDFGGASIKRTHKLKYSLVKKTSAGYDEKKNVVSWKFELNQFGANIDFLNIEDTLKASEQSFDAMKENGSYKDIVLYPYVGSDSKQETPSGGAERVVPYAVSKEAAQTQNWQDWYTITKDAAADTESLYLHLGKGVGSEAAIQKNQRYTFTLQTNITKLDAVTETGTTWPLTNQASFAGATDGMSIEKTTSATCPVSNTIIRKEAIPFNEDASKELRYKYNFADNTVKWRVTVNPHSWDLYEPVITDQLPEGTRLSAVTKVTYDGRTLDIKPDQANSNVFVGQDNISGAQISFREVNQTSELGSGAHQLVVNFIGDSTGNASAIAPMNHPLTFEFTTSVDENYRLETFKSNSDAKLINPVQVNGKYGDADTAFTAKDQAVNTFEPAPMKKDGLYFTNQAVDLGLGTENPVVSGVNWNLYVNRVKNSIGGATVTDTIADCMELLPETLKVYTVVLDQQGNEKTSETKEIYPNPASELTKLTLDPFKGNQFSCTIPEEYKEATLKFVYTTVMVEDAKATDITNCVDFKFGGKDDTTGDVLAKGALSFNLSSYAHAQGMYFTKITKTSTNVQDGKKFPLQGAVFSIYEMQRMGNGDGSSPADWEQVKTEPDKTRTSAVTGKVSLMFLKPDTLYKIVEDAAPFGYETPASFVWYVVPKKTAASVESYPEKPNDPQTSGYDITINDGSFNYLLMDIGNIPLETGAGVAELQLKKTGHQGQPLRGVRFVLKDNDGILRDKEYASDVDGIVKLTGLDVQTTAKEHLYTLEEKAPAGYKNPVKLKIKVSYDSAGKKVVAKFVDPLEELKQDFEGKYILENEAITQSGSFQKVDQNGDVLLQEGITFKVSRRGDGGSVIDGNNGAENSPVILAVDSDDRVTDKNEYASYLAKKAVKTDSTGKVLLENLLYGDYKLEEQAFDAVQPGKMLASVYLTVNAKGMFASTISLEDAKTEKIKLTENTPNVLSVTNHMKHGILQVNKLAGENTDTGWKPIEMAGKKLPLEDITFNIYRDKGTIKIFEASTDSLFMTLKTNEDGNFTVDKNGYYTTTAGVRKQLTVGNYFLEELKSESYNSVMEKIPFEIQAGTSTGTDYTPETVYMDSVTGTTNTDSATMFFNEPKRGSVEGIKYTSDKGEKKIPLAGAKFELTPTGETTGPSRTAVSGTEGHFVFEKVPLGTYKVEEIETPNGYRSSDKIVNVEVTQDKQQVSTDMAGALIEFWNEAFGSLTLIKRAERIEDGSSGGVLRPGQGFAFRIIGESMDGDALETFIKSSDIDGAAAISIVEAGENPGVYVTTGAGGKLTIFNLPVGEYSVQEQINEKNDVAGIYRPDMQVKAANITITHATGKIISPTVGIDNYLKRGAIQGLKTTTDKTTPLKDAVIGLFPAGTKEFTEANLWCGQKFTTGANGIFHFDNIPYGTYLVAELTAPSGYHLNTGTRYEVTVKAEETVSGGKLIEGTEPKADEDSGILITNAKKSSGGGGGGITPTLPTETQNPTAPSESRPVNPEETFPTLPEETTPGIETVIPVPPEIPPGSNVDINKPDGENVYHGKTDDSGSIRVTLPSGEYNVVMIDDNNVPLAAFPFTIEDLPVPLGAPDAGDHSVPIAVLAVVMILSLVGIILLARRKKEFNESEKAE